MRLLKPSKIKLFRSDGNCRLTIEGECSYLKVMVSKAFPLSHQNNYIFFYDGHNNQEIGTLKSLTGLSPNSKKILYEEFDKRYFIPIIKKINSLRGEYGALYWEVETDKGKGQFVVREFRENIVEFGNNRLYIVDINGNRFEVSNRAKLDLFSQRLLAQWL